jgi:cation diffusion facilitator CzcD-associated flavoprotein CzcO
VTDLMDARATDGTGAVRHVDAVVVGAGFAGMYMLIKLRELGMSSAVLEAGADVGGTWYWNRYPGARCDVESINYSYSFDPELEQEWRWSERYSPQPEILQYAQHVADRYDLRKDIQFDTRVTSAVFDERANRWTVTTEQGEVFSSRFCVMATGCLSVSKAPEVPGADSFAGPTYHTGHWPHEGVDFTGMRVGVIGTGSSAIQSIPIIAQQASDLVVFQRTPNFSLPAGNRALTDDEVAEIKARYPDHRAAARMSGFGVPVDEPTMSALEDDPDHRESVYKTGYESGNLVGMLLAYNDIITNKESNDTAAEYVRKRSRGIVQDPEVAELLAPKDHPLGTKRPCLDTGYYATYNRENVHLVDLRSEPIAEITPTGIRTNARSYEFDAIVFATGFDAMTGALTNIDLRGRGGQSLKEQWAPGPQTYLGLAVPGFPNMFTVTGPQSPSVFSNMMVSIEQHVEWIAECFAYLREHANTVIEATDQATHEWGAHVKEAGDATLYPLANSWYMGSNVPGKPRVMLPYIGGVGAYREICDRVAANGYEGFALG